MAPLPPRHDANPGRDIPALEPEAVDAARVSGAAGLYPFRALRGLVSQATGRRTANPAAIYYNRVEYDNAANPTALNFIRTDKAPAETPAMRDLYNEIIAVFRMVNLLFDHPKLRETRRRFQDRLKETGRIGLCTADFVVEAGQDDLAEIKQQIADEFPLIRNLYWKIYFFWFIGLTVTGGVLGAVIYCAAFYGLLVIPSPLAEWLSQQRMSEPAVLGWARLAIAFFWIPMGAALGIFTEFYFRIGDTVSYAELQNINPGRWNAGQRVINIVVTGYLFAALMGLNVVQIGVGNVLLNEFCSTKPYLSLLLGFVSGFGFPYVRDIIYKIQPVAKAAG